MVGIYGIIGEFSRGKSPGTVDAVGFWPTASILFCFYGAGGGTRTHTPLRITDFESVSSANSDTPAFIFLSLTPDVLSEKSEGHRGGTLKTIYILSCQRP